VADAAGNRYAIGADDSLVRRLDVATNVVTTVADDGTIFGPDGEDVPATSVGLNPLAIAVDGHRLFVATDGKLRIVDLQTGLIRSVVGFQPSCDSLTEPDCLFPSDIEVDRAGRLVTADRIMHAIRRVTLR